MRVCVYGAGAVGSYVVGMLSAVDGLTVSAVARGPNLTALRSSGVIVDGPEGTWSGRPIHATDDHASLPRQDLVLVTLKSTALAENAGAIARLLAGEGTAIFATNGIPWWWNHGAPPALAIPSLISDRPLWEHLKPQQVLGCVIHSGNELIAPGHVRHNGSNSWPLGELDGVDRPRSRSIAEVLRRGQLKAFATTEIRREILVKLLRNASLNSVCALTGLPMEWLTLDASLRDLIRTIVDEVASIGAACGFEMREEAARFRELPEPKPGASPADGLKPSMLQDMIAGRSLEVETIIGQTCALGERCGIPCPALNTLLPLLRGLEVRRRLCI